MKTLLSCVLVLAMTLFANTSNANTLYPGWGLQPGQGVTSQNGEYVLIMQGDGNLVYYRTSDNAVRWSSNTWGAPNSFLTMQTDGNAVVYFDPPVIQPSKGQPPTLTKPSTGRIPVWYSSTSGNSGAYLIAANDGNLAVNNASHQPLWHIGPDPVKLIPDPTKIGDLVGREMENGKPYAFLGHIGFYDGSNVFEVLNDGASNAASYSSLGAFKARAPGAKYWGAASANIPSYFVKGCYKDMCTDSPGNYQVLDAKIAMAHRAFQIMVLGADYTYFTQYTPASPKYSSSGKAKRGIYRCDTFILDLLGPHGNHVNAEGFPIASPAPESHLGRWFSFTASLPSGLITPLSIFQKMKSFTG